MNAATKKQFQDLLQIAWPLIIANSFWNLQLTIDRIFLGAHSTESLGAAMTVMGVFWVPMALLQQTSSYVTTFVAQYYGAKEYHKIGQALWQAIYVSIFGGILFLGLNFLSAPFFDFVGHTNSLKNLETIYFNSLAYSALPTALVAAISGFFTGLGQTRTVIGINFVGLVFNALFDYLLIEGRFGFPALGIEGAGYATSAATYLAALYGGYLIWNKKYEEKFRVLSSLAFSAKLSKQFLRFGIPSGMQWALEGLAFTTFLVLMGRMPSGEAALASSSIAVTVLLLAILPAMGVAQAVMTLVGQRLGEKKPDEAEQFVYRGVQVSALYIFCAAICFWLFPNFFLSWFENQDNASLWAEVQAYGAMMLKIVGVAVMFDSIYLNISFALKGAGDTRFVSLASLIIPWPFLVFPTIYVSEMPDAPTIAWMFVAMYTAILATVLGVRFRMGKWKTLSVIHPEEP